MTTAAQPGLQQAVGEEWHGRFPQPDGVDHDDPVGPGLQSLLDGIAVELDATDGRAAAQVGGIGQVAAAEDDAHSGSPDIDSGGGQQIRHPSQQPRHVHLRDAHPLRDLILAELLEVAQLEDAALTGRQRRRAVRSTVSRAST